jgi:predicted GNAT family acetyltransferase
MHTEVPPELRGRKYAEVLARAGLEHARGANLKVVPFCPFVRAFLQRHPEYVAVLDEHWKAILEQG